MTCRICGDPHHRYRELCDTCYRYRHRNGRDRTEQHVIRHTTREFERQLAERLERRRRQYHR